MSYSPTRAQRQAARRAGFRKWVLVHIDGGREYAIVFADRNYTKLRAGGDEKAIAALIQAWPGWTHKPDGNYELGPRQVAAFLAEQSHAFAWNAI